jgi:hypothetical protein
MEEEQRDIRPIPDPTELTSKAVDRAVEVARLFTEGEVTHLRELMNVQFEAIESWRKEQKADTKAAVDAALAAAKEAVKEQTQASQLAINKSETATIENIKQQNVTFSTANTGLTRELAAVTTRVERIENLKQGGQDIVAKGLAVVFGLAAFVSILLYVQSIKAR